MSLKDKITSRNILWFLSILWIVVSALGILYELLIKHLIEGK